jgi:FtsH-binding integral membrane protein
MFATVETKLWRSASEVNESMVRVYNHMFLAILTSGVVSYLVSSSPGLMAFLFGTWFKWIVIFAPLVAVFGITIALRADPPKSIAVLMLHGFAALMGLSFATIFAVYTMGSIVSAFFGAGVLFGTMSLYGYFTKQSLDAWGKYLIVGLIAIIIASIVNIFIGSTVFQTTISAVAIIIFLGLTAYDTQQIREMVSEHTTDAIEVMGALSLYLNFINLFMSLLQLFGGKKE